MNATETVKVDILADLDDRYELAVRNGEKEVVETLERIDIWSETMQTFLFLVVWRSAVKGDSEAAVRTGHFFDWHNEKKKNARYDRPELAKYWYRKAADAGNANGQGLLGILLRHAKTEAERKEGIALLERASAQGHRDAKMALAECLRCGQCVASDFARARRLEKEAEESSGVEREWTRKNKRKEKTKWTKTTKR